MSRSFEPPSLEGQVGPSDEVQGEEGEIGENPRETQGEQEGNVAVETAEGEES
jgi:hypothetical protein